MMLKVCLCALVVSAALTNCSANTQGSASSASSANPQGPTISEIREKVKNSFPPSMFGGAAARAGPGYSISHAGFGGFNHAQGYPFSYGAHQEQPDYPQAGVSAGAFAQAGQPPVFRRSESRGNNRGHAERQPEVPPPRFTGLSAPMPNIPSVPRPSAPWSNGRRENRGPTYRQPNPYQGGYGASVAASASASASVNGQEAASSASAAAPSYNHREADEEHVEEHYLEPETVNEFSAQSGVFDDDGSAYESNTLMRKTASEYEHEDGEENGDHYFRSINHARSANVNDNFKFKTDQEDLMETPNMRVYKKNKTKVKKNFQSNHSESGSDVKAQDKTRVAWNRDAGKLNETVKQRYEKGSAGSRTTMDSSSSTNVDDEEGFRMDNRGLDGYKDMNGVEQPKRYQPAVGHAAAATAAVFGRSR